MRFLTIFLCVMLAATAIGRFRAEAAHRSTFGELRATQGERAAAELEEHRLRLEVEVLESATRLGEVNAQTVRMAPARPEQFEGEADFAAAIGREISRPGTPFASDTIGNAIAMSDPEAALPSERTRP
jgi:cell division protein FtsL